MASSTSLIERRCYNARGLAIDRPATLSRRLGLLETTLSGVGIILGAGIYVLIGEAAAEAGNAVWISFVLAALMAAVVGLSYAELVSTYPKAGADYEYTRNAFGQRAAFVVGWLIVIGNLIAASAVSLGFGSYLRAFVDVDATVIAMVLLVVMTVVAFYGIRESVWTSVVFTLVEAGGLIFVVVIGVPHFGDVDLLQTSDLGTAGIFSGAALVVFAFVGFEQIATLAEETTDAPRTIPKALLMAIVITTSLYLLVALAAVSVLGWEELSASDAPLAAVTGEVLGDRGADFLALVGLFATANTVLLLLVAASRLIYGMSTAGSLPRFLAWIHPRVHTPVRAIAVSLVVCIGFVLPGDIGLVAGATNFAVFIGFFAINLSLIVLRFTQPDVSRPFRLPLNIGRLPLLPIVALGSVAFMMANLERDALIIGGALFTSGLIAMEVLSLWKPVQEPDGG